MKKKTSHNRYRFTRLLNGGYHISCEIRDPHRLKTVNFWQSDKGNAFYYEKRVFDQLLIQ